jgi:hypothetical protein
MLRRWVEQFGGLNRSVCRVVGGKAAERLRKGRSERLEALRFNDGPSVNDIPICLASGLPRYATLLAVVVPLFSKSAQSWGWMTGCASDVHGKMETNRVDYVEWSRVWLVRPIFT